MKTVVITGGIGSGKSVVCRYLAERYGWPVYEADSRVKQLYLQHPTLLSDIEDSLGVSLRDGDERFNPKLLADVIFRDPEALAKVEELVFPALTEDFEQWKMGHVDSRFVAIESATILEKPQLKDMGDIVVLIDAPVKVRTDRAAARDAVRSVCIQERIRNQKLMNDISEGVVECPADYRILNDRTPVELMQNIDNLVKILV